MHLMKQAQYHLMSTQSANNIIIRTDTENFLEATRNDIEQQCHTFCVSFLTFHF